MADAKKKIPVDPFWIWLAVLIILGLILRYAVVGYGFSSNLCFGLAALIVLFKLMGVYEKNSGKSAKDARSFITFCICVFLILAIITGTLIVHDAFGEEFRDNDYIVVLGAAVHGSTPSLSLNNRIVAAYEYLTAHPNTICVVSGGQGEGEYISEAQCMYNELVSRGISPNRIWMESQATSTMENLQFSLDLIERRTGKRPDEIGLVTSEYHLFRAGLMSKKCGAVANGIPATTTWLSLRLNYFLREIFAVWHFVIFGK